MTSEPIPPTFDDLDSAVAEVMAAIRAHRGWFARWHRHAVCRTAPDADMIADDAHERCRFGRWYAVFAPNTDVTRELVVAVGMLHQEFHVRTRGISAQIASDRPILAADYEALERVAEQFMRQVLAIERTLRSRAAERDPLTGTNTRLAMLSRLEREHELVENGTPACIAMIDVDHFKRVNDSQGHAAGDEVLRSVAGCMRDVLRPRDTVFRYGGDEFLICLTDISAGPAIKVFERLRRLVAEQQIGEPPITLSIGIAEMDPRIAVEECILRADRALYAAKEAGRDRVMLDPDARSGV